MIIIDAKEYLEQARFLDMRISAKQAQLDSLHHLMLKLGGSDKAAAKISILQEKINRDIDSLVNLKDEITCRISQLSKPEYQTVLELRYLCFWSWEKISVNMHYCPSYLYELHNAALKELNEILLRPE